MTAAITVDGLSKAYRIGVEDEKPDTLLGAAAALLRAPLRNLDRLRRLDTRDSLGDSGDLVWALKDVSFAVDEGEVLGIIGRNGAGKSTLLKMLARITEPTRGRAVIRGRVSSLLEVGTGFHPELTGRENVYMNGTILGMTKREIDRKFDEIVEFSGVERFLDTPIKRYSSGMKVRLAFAVAAHLEPEILIVDEVLAVGDFEFQEKCLGKMKDVAGAGRTVLFVSHNMPAVRSLCQRVVRIADGVMVGDGAPSEEVGAYLASRRRLAATDLRSREDRRGSGAARITDVVFRSEGRAVDVVAAGAPLSLELHYEPRDGRSRVTRVAVGCFSESGVHLFHVDSDMSPRTPPWNGAATCTFGRWPLPAGDYQFDVKIEVDGTVADHVESAATLRTTDGDVFGVGKAADSRGGLFFPDHTWSPPRASQSHVA